MQGRAAWFVASMLGLLSILMSFHLLSVWIGVSVCRSYADAVIDPAATVTGAEGIAANCGRLNSELNEAVDKYLSVILSLIGGAAVSGGVAVAATRKDDDQP